MANLSSSAVVESTVLLTDNNAHPNLAHFKVRYWEFALMERGWAGWTGPGLGLSNSSERV